MSWSDKESSETDFDEFFERLYELVYKVKEEVEYLSVKYLKMNELRT